MLQCYNYKECSILGRAKLQKLIYHTVKYNKNISMINIIKVVTFFKYLFWKNNRFFFLLI